MQSTQCSEATLHPYSMEQYADDVCLLLQGPVTHVRTVSIGEKRQPAANTHTIVNKNHALITPASKSTPGTRYAAAVCLVGKVKCFC